MNDPVHATAMARVYERACKKQHVRGCVNAGFWVEKAGGTKAAGLALYKKAATVAAQRCERKKDAAICGWLAHFYDAGDYLPKDEKKAERYRQRACKLLTNTPCATI